MTSVSAVLFTKDQMKVSRFYRDALGLKCTESSEDYSILNCDGFELVIHQIPKQYLGDSKNSGSPVKRGNGPLRLDFPVESISEARTIAASLGGQVDDEPPAWAERDANFYLGHDPEGNVFKLEERAR